jgi:hypothetical protein
MAALYILRFNDLPFIAYHNTNMPDRDRSMHERQGGTES